MASRIGMLWIEITPKAVRTSHCSRKAAITSPTVVVLDMTCKSSGNIDMAPRRIGRQVRGQIKECLRRFFRTSEAAKRNVFLASQFSRPCFPALTVLRLCSMPPAPLTRLHNADQDRIDANALRREFGGERLDEAQHPGACRRCRDHMRLWLQREKRIHADNRRRRCVAQHRQERAGRRSEER